MQVEIINLYYFSLTETDEIYLERVNLLLKNIRDYLQEEGIQLKHSQKDVGNYNVIEFHLEDIGKLLFFQKEKSLPKELRYFPEMYCEIHIEEQYLENDDKLRKLIFLLSNIFECFDIIDERYIFIEYHSHIKKLKANYATYKLRHNFHDINQLGKSYDFESIQKNLQDFLSNNLVTRDISQIQRSFPETYISLLLFCYLIFSLEKNKASLQKELKELKNTNFLLQEGTSNKQLFILRVQNKIQNIEKVLKIYTLTFEKFLKLFL